MDNKAYASTIVDLGYSAQPIGTDDNGAVVDASDSSALYTFEISSTTASTSGIIRAFTVSAVPRGTQATRDSGCGTLTITEAGVKKAGGVINDECW